MWDSRIIVVMSTVIVAKKCATSQVKCLYLMRYILLSETFDDVTAIKIGTFDKVMCLAKIVNFGTFFCVLVWFSRRPLQTCFG